MDDLSDLIQWKNYKVLQNQQKKESVKCQLTFSHTQEIVNNGINANFVLLT